MKKRLTALMLFVMLLCCSFTTVFAAKNSDVTRVFKAVVTNTDFAEKMQSVVPLYADKGVTEAGVNQRIKMLITRVLDLALEEKKNGTLTEENMNSRFKAILTDAVMTLEPVYISMILDAYPQETIMKIAAGEVPAEFQNLYNVLHKEARCVLGFQSRDTEIIFDDMQGYEWAYTAVDDLFNKDVINGTSDFIFNPSISVTREQFVKMICTAFDIEDGSIECAFSDVSSADWYYPYVMKMASNGLVTGISSSLFGAGNNISRQDMAVLIYRIGENLGYFSPESLKLPFSDQNSISDYALTAVNTLKNNGVINGDDNNTFNPQKGASRAEAAQMVYNFCTYAEKINK